jgi:CheY-like chemotaxis protein
VEDDQDIREAILEILEEEGFAFTGVVDGAQALEHLDGSIVEPDLKFSWT